MPTQELHEVARRSADEEKPVRFANIVLATDFSPISDRALEYALAIARRYGAKLFVTHILTPNGFPMVAPETFVHQQQKARAEANQKFRQLVESGRLIGVAHQVSIEEGSLWPAIQAFIEKHNIHLVVVGTHGLGGWKKVVLGSGAEQIFRHATAPVLTVGPAATAEAPYETEFKNILFATDFGPYADLEAALAFSLAQEHRSRLTFLNVLEGKPSAAAAAERKVAVLQLLQALVPTTAERKCKLEFKVALGETVQEILNYAGDTKADLIVLGAKAAKGITGSYLHTKAYGVVSQAKCPVLTIRSE